MGAVTIVGLGKAYRQYKHPSGRLLEWLGAGTHHTERWILRNLNLSISAGESIGLIGRNGAGKSTLLKLVTGVSIPTEGSVFLNSVWGFIQNSLGDKTFICKAPYKAGAAGKLTVLFPLLLILPKLVIILIAPFVFTPVVCNFDLHSA
jgi:ABC-type polysaccharide/polyol phosphate transport system ATPase subunit